MDVLPLETEVGDLLVAPPPRPWQRENKNKNKTKSQACQPTLTSNIRLMFSSPSRGV